MNPSPSDVSACPMCGVDSAQGHATACFVFLGQVYYFCCPACRDRFAQHPEHFVICLAHTPQAHLCYPCPQLAKPGRKDVGLFC